jgi:hypothetical protein
MLELFFINFFVAHHLFARKCCNKGLGSVEEKMRRSHGLPAPCGFSLRLLKFHSIPGFYEVRKEYGIFVGLGRIIHSKTINSKAMANVSCLAKYS